MCCPGLSQLSSSIRSRCFPSSAFATTLPPASTIIFSPPPATTWGYLSESVHYVFAQEDQQGLRYRYADFHHCIIPPRHTSPTRKTHYVATRSPCEVTVWQNLVGTPYRSSSTRIHGCLLDASLAPQQFSSATLQDPSTITKRLQLDYSANIRWYDYALDSNYHYCKSIARSS